MPKLRHIPWNVLLSEEQPSMVINNANITADPLMEFATNVDGIQPNLNDVGADVAVNPQQNPDLRSILQLHSSDYPDMKLISFQLNGTNYLSWHRSMCIELGAKDKLSFVDGSFIAPLPDSPDFAAYKRVDCMIIAWILNSLSAEIAPSFIYAASASILWNELAMRFGESNVTLIYQLKRDIVNLIQGNLSVMAYYNKLHELWDELTQLLPIPHGIRAADRTLMDFENTEKLMQFLVGLNKSFDAIRSQILLLDPLPPVAKAYSIIIKY